MHDLQKTQSDSMQLLGSLAPSDKETKNLIVSAGLLQSIREDREYFYTSLPCGTKEEKVLVHNAMKRTENDIFDLITPNTFVVKDFVLSKIRYTNESGETISGPKLTLISVNGDVKTVLARIFIEQFLQLFPIFGLPPWEDGMTLSAKHNKGNGPNRFYSLILVG